MPCDIILNQNFLQTRQQAFYYLYCDIVTKMASSGNSGNNSEKDKKEVDEFIDDEWKNAKPAVNLESLNNDKKKEKVTVFDGTKVVHVINLDEKQQHVKRKYSPRKAKSGTNAAAEGLVKFQLETHGAQDVSINVQISTNKEKTVDEPGSSNEKSNEPIKIADIKLIPDAEPVSTAVEMRPTDPKHEKPMKPPKFINE